MTSTHAQVCAVCSRTEFADRQIPTVVNLRLPIPVADRFGERFWSRPRDSRAVMGFGGFTGLVT